MTQSAQESDSSDGAGGSSRATYATVVEARSGGLLLDVHAGLGTVPLYDLFFLVSVCFLVEDPAVRGGNRARSGGSSTPCAGARHLRRTNAAHRSLSISARRRTSMIPLDSHTPTPRQYSRSVGARRVVCLVLFHSGRSCIVSPFHYPPRPVPYVFPPGLDSRLSA